jgi:hypothetical protein
VTASFETLMGLDARLAAKGEYPLPAFWHEPGRRLYEHPTANTLVARCGRGSVKSGFGSRVALNEFLFGDFETPASEIHYWVDLSENKGEALQRLRQYETWLGLLGVAFERRGDEIVVPSLRRGFMVRAFDVGAVSGFRAIGYRSDELAKCDNRDDAADPASKVIASVKAMTVTHGKHRPKGLLLASPVGLDDYHAECFEVGNTAEQIVCEGATWVCNPSITEAETHALERDPDTWSREYAAIPSESETTAFVRSDVAHCWDHDPRYYAFGQPFMALDPASTSNTFAWLLARWGEPDKAQHFKQLDASVHAGLHAGMHIGVARDDYGMPIKVPVAERPLLQIFQVGGWTGEELRQTPMNVVARELWRILTAAGADTIVSDKHGDVFLAGLISEISGGRARFRSFNQTQTSKHEAVTYLRALMRDRQIIIVEHDGMRRDLETYPRRIVGGGFKYGAPRAGHHWDHASSAVIMAHSFLERESNDPQDTTLRIENNPARLHRGGRTVTSGR